MGKGDGREKGGGEAWEGATTPHRNLIIYINPLFLDNTETHTQPGSPFPCFISLSLRATGHHCWLTPSVHHCVGYSPPAAHHHQSPTVLPAGTHANRASHSLPLFFLLYFRLIWATSGLPCVPTNSHHRHMTLPAKLVCAAAEHC